MNRPTIDVEELLDMANEALVAGDVQNAISMLRKASSVAPLRKDIRNRLALVLERGGDPIGAAAPHTGWTDSYQNHDDLPVEAESAGRESIADLARRAFEAASVQSSKAGVATRRLTSILQQGLGSWRSGRGTAATVAFTDGANSGSANAVAGNVFEPEQDLKAYLDRVSTQDLEDEAYDDLVDSELPETSRMVKPATESRKERRATTRKKSTRPTEVEDVLAAGIGGFIEAAGRLNKQKITYSLVYAGMIGLFGFACFDTSRKFGGGPESASPVTAASVGTVSFNAQSGQSVIEHARNLVADKKFAEATGLLQGELEAGKLLAEREPVRVELASAYNAMGEDLLMNNKYEESVAAYRQSLKYAPTDNNLQIRLANALYYKAIVSNAPAESRNSALQEATEILNKCIQANTSDPQGHRLLALVYESRGMKDKSQDEWKKARALVPENSPISQEAAQHLK